MIANVPILQDQNAVSTTKACRAVLRCAANV